MIPAASVTGRTATAHRSSPASVPSRTFRQSLVILTLICACLPQVRAVIPSAAESDPLYAKGYLNVSRYFGTDIAYKDPSLPANATNTTAKLNEAIVDAYNGKLVVYIPSGTYVVNNTIKAYTAAGIGGAAWNTPAKHIAIVGNRVSRPVIKLAWGAIGFNNPAKPKAVVEFMNFAIVKRADLTGSDIKIPVGETDKFRYFWEDPSTGFGQMIRDVEIDCRQSGNPIATDNDGAIGLYFNQAQTSSIENVRVSATGALSGITGLPGRSWGAVNIEVIGGQYGIDTNPVPREEANPTEVAALIAPYIKGDGTALTPKSGQNLFSPTNAGSVIVGAKLTNQEERAVRLGSFVPVVMVGFEITSDTDKPVLTVVPKAQTGGNALSLIDGKINRSGSFTTMLIENSYDNGAAVTVGNNLYMRNVYTKGSDNLLKSGSRPTVTASGTWKRIDEYSYCADAVPGGGFATAQQAYNLINGELNITEYKTAIVSNLPTSPADLITRHVWASLPAMTDSDVVDVTTLGVVPAASETDLVSHFALQAIINANSSPNPQKNIFLPKGIYRLTGPIILRANTVLFGAGRQLTRIEVAPSFPIMMNGSVPTETPIITTVDDPDATTYLGDLTIGVDVGLPNADDLTPSGMLARDWFVALHWKAGRKSMVHMGQPYRVNTSTNREATNAHSLMKITHNGGGRWYFAGAIKTRTGGHSNYRILKVTNTSQALSIYGLNVEHPGGEEDFSGLGGTFLGTVAGTSPTTFTEFYNAENIRIYGVKSEFSAKDGQRDEPLLGDKLVDATGPISPAGNSRVASFVSCKNIAVFGPGAIRNGVNSKGVFEFNSTCARVLATQITPQLDRFSTPDDDTLKEPGQPENGTFSNGITYPNVVALFKRGLITQVDEDVMKHN